MSACKDKCEYGTCGFGNPEPCGGCCGCMGGCFVEYEEQMADQFAREHENDALEMILLEIRDAGDSLE